MGTLPFISAFSLWLCSWFSRDELFFHTKMLFFFFQVSLVQEKACLPKHRDGALFTFQASSSLWGLVLLLLESYTLGMAAPSQTRRTLRSPPWSNKFSHPHLDVFYPPECYRTAHPQRGHQLLQAACLSYPSSHPGLFALESLRCHSLSSNGSEFWSQACTRSKRLLVLSFHTAELELLLIHPKYQNWPS